jgi:putative membrane protein
MMFGGGMILIWLIVIAGAYFVIKSLTDSSRNSGSRGEDPLKILELRYAKGEIDREEYLERKENLNH